MKTTLAPGSKVVTDYYEKSGLTPPPREAGIRPRRLRLYDVYWELGAAPARDLGGHQRCRLGSGFRASGNRNFEGRINPDVKMNYLASPPLVVAYAIAGTMDIDLQRTSRWGTDPAGELVFLKRHLAERT